MDTRNASSPPPSFPAATELSLIIAIRVRFTAPRPATERVERMHVSSRRSSDAACSTVRPARRVSARAARPAMSLAALQCAFGRSVGRVACPRCKGAGVVATSRRKADDVQCPVCMAVKS